MAPKTEKKKSRRANNEGSITQLKDGRWQARITIDGRRKPFYGKTREEAAKKLNSALADRDKGLPVGQDERVTVGKFLENWLEQTARPSIRPSTYKSYSSYVKGHLIPELGKIALTKLTPAQVQAMLARKRESKLSPRTLQYLRAILRRALGQALKWGQVGRNVAALTDPPKMVRHEIQPLTPEQVRTFLEVVRGDRLEALYSVAVSLGLRQGEALGLRWQDIDFDGGTLRVAVALQRINKEYKLVEPKTARSRRTLPLPQVTVAALRAHKVRQLEERLQAGAAWHDWGLVFTREDGWPLNSTTTTHRFQRILERAGLPKVRFHDLRHTCATMLLAQGVPARLIMEILGHSQISLTMNTYAHVLPATQREAANLMDAMLAAR